MDDVSFYEPYFLGPVVTYESGGNAKYLADGQQRFITLLLLLIHIRRLLQDQEDDATASEVERLISQSDFQRRVFLVDVKEYNECFQALYSNDAKYGTDGEPPDVIRVHAAYEQIETLFPPDIRIDALPHFAHWLLRRVSFVELAAGGSRRAKEIFRTMNDRGIHLSPMDHIKAYLLEDAGSEERSLEHMWNTMVASLDAIEAGAAAEFIQNLLRARYWRPTASGSDETFDEHGSFAPHEWMRLNRRRIWPSGKNGERATWIRTVAVPISKPYEEMLRAKARMTRGLEVVYYNAHNGIERQFDLALACIQPSDFEATKRQKMQMCAQFADTFFVRTAANNQTWDQREFDRTVSELAVGVRAISDVRDIGRTLASSILEKTDDFGGVESLRNRKGNRFVHYFLARLTGWLEAGARRGDIMEQLLSRTRGVNRYQIEHLYPANPADGVADESYKQNRERIGALVLLDGPDNAGMRDAPLFKKVNWYPTHNLLAGSLSGALYRKGRLTGFGRFVEAEGIASHFKSYDVMDGMYETVAGRSRLYRAMAERIWALELIGTPIHPGSEPPRRTRRQYRVGVGMLLSSGLISSGDSLVGSHKGLLHQATVLSDGRIKTSSGATFDSPSAAAIDTLDRRAWNGWTFWRHVPSGRRLDELRSDLL